MGGWLPSSSAFKAGTAPRAWKGRLGGGVWKNDCHETPLTSALSPGPAGAWLQTERTRTPKARHHSPTTTLVVHSSALY